MTIANISSSHTQKNQPCDGHPSCALVFSEPSLASTTIGTCADDSIWQEKSCVCFLRPPYNFTLPNGGGSGVERRGVEDGREYRHPAKHDGKVLAKSPPSRPIFSGPLRTTSRSSKQQTLGHPARGSSSRLAKFFSTLFRMPGPSRKLEWTVRESQPPTFRCRYPECAAPVRSDEAARLGGFCCDTHMWLVVLSSRRIWYLCPE